MYIYASQASIGDDVYGEPSTRALEDHVARITGKEAGLFVPSGTMSNQLALRTHLKQPPYSVLCDHRAHIIKYAYYDSRFDYGLIAFSRYEAGGAAFHSGASTIPVVPSNGQFPTYCSSCLLLPASFSGHHLVLADVQSHIELTTDVHW